MRLPALAAIRSALALAARLLALAAGLVLAAWAVGQVLTDRTIATQYLYWIPTPAMLGGATVLLALSWAVGRLAPARRHRHGSGRRRPSPPRPGRVARRIAGAALVLGAAYMGLVEWRLHALVTRPGPGRGLSVLYWNAPQRPRQVAEQILSYQADLILIANPPAAMRPRWLTEPAEAPYKIRTDRFLVVSRYPLIRWGSTSLGLAGREQVPIEGWESLGLPEGSVDDGRAMFFELDAAAVLGRTIVVWLVDLPSDQRLGRWDIMRAAADRIRAWRGPVQVAAGAAPEVGLPESGASGFPGPDLIVGDFNTPRGSASLDLLTGGLPNAYDQGGAGYAATFPRERPLWHIDQMFVGPGLRAARYDVAQPPQGRHWIQLAKIVPADP